MLGPSRSTRSSAPSWITSALQMHPARVRGGETRCFWILADVLSIRSFFWGGGGCPGDTFRL